MPFCIGCVKNFDEITLSCMVKEIEANFCFSIFGKNSKIQNGRHFWEEEIFLKTAKRTLLRYPVGRKFRRNLTRLRRYKQIFDKNSKNQNGRHMWEEEEEIALSRTVKEIAANLYFSTFWQKFENTKWPPFLGRGNYFENCQSTLLIYPVGRKFRRNRSISHG